MNPSYSGCTLAAGGAGMEFLPKNQPLGPLVDVMLAEM